MSETGYKVARFLGVLWPLFYAVFAAFVGAMALQDFRDGNVRGGIGFCVPVAIALYMLYNSLVRWRTIADKRRPK